MRNLLGLSLMALAWPLAVACGNQAPQSQPQGSAAPAPQPVPGVARQADPLGFAANIRSLLLGKTVSVRLDADENGKRIGTIAVDTRVEWANAKVGPGCKKPWVQVMPAGWICSDFATPQTKAPAGQEVPRLDGDEIVPGVYGKVTSAGAMMYEFVDPSKDKKRVIRRDRRDKPVTAPEPAPTPVAYMKPKKPIIGSVNVRRYDEITVAGKVYWKVSDKNEYVARASISQHRPSTYAGVRFGDETGLTLPLGVVWPRGGGAYAWARGKAVGGGVTQQLAKRTPVSIKEIVNDAKGKPSAYRIGAEWIDAANVRLFTPAPPPRGLLPNERWIDIDLDSQILVAMEGDIAVFATMISSGAKDTPTEPGVYRMWKKVSETDMSGLDGEDPYSVATVPWTQFFSPERGLAIHTAYWHDNFGTPRSHGCINASPQDARWLYYWSDPQIYPGWSMAAGVTEAPGSIVRARTKDQPNPPERGYAIKVTEARLRS